MRSINPNSLPEKQQIEEINQYAQEFASSSDPLLQEVSKDLFEVVDTATLWIWRQTNGTWPRIDGTV